MLCYFCNLQWSSSSWCFPSFPSNLFKLASSVSLGNNFCGSGIFWACFLSPSLNVPSYCQSSSIFLMSLAICRSLSEFLCGYSSNVKSPTILNSSSICSHFLPLMASLVFQLISYISVSITGDCVSTWWHNYVFWVFFSLLLLIIHNIWSGFLLLMSTGHIYFMELPIIIENFASEWQWTGQNLLFSTSGQGFLFKYIVLSRILNFICCFCCAVTLQYLQLSVSLTAFE